MYSIFIFHLFLSGYKPVHKHATLIPFILTQYRYNKYLTNYFISVQITEHVLGVWQGGPSRVVGVLGQRAADLLVVCGAAPAVVASVREGFNLDLPLTKAHPEFTSALMDMLTGL